MGLLSGQKDPLPLEIEAPSASSVGGARARGFDGGVVGLLGGVAGLAALLAWLALPLLDGSGGRQAATNQTTASSTAETIAQAPSSPALVSLDPPPTLAAVTTPIRGEFRAPAPQEIAVVDLPKREAPIVRNEPPPVVSPPRADLLASVDAGTSASGEGSLLVASTTEAPKDVGRQADGARRPPRSQSRRLARRSRGVRDDARPPPPSAASETTGAVPGAAGTSRAPAGIRLPTELLPTGP